MSKMFTKGFKPKSTTKEAKAIIRKEMLSCFPAKEYGVNSNLDAMRLQAEHTSISGNDFHKAKKLVDDGFCAIYYDDQKKMLSKIYGKKNVDNWDGQKIHNTYGNLIGREYASMLKEQRNKRK